MLRVKMFLFCVTPLFFLLIFNTGSAYSQEMFPTAKEIADEMGLAWNLGNTMEAIGGPTSWGNPLPTQLLMDSIKAAGFNTVRIPTAWDIYADQITLEIPPEWIAQVKEVVDFSINADLYVILNIHWDGGWLEEHVNAESQAEVNRKQGSYWKQIATAFASYDHRLLFASTNEPSVNDAYGVSFDAERMAILNSYHQTFIDTVRAISGNTSRTLIIQGPRTDIELTNRIMTTLPVDPTPDRLMLEIHFYPYQFTLMSEFEDWGKPFFYWGQGNHSPHPEDADHNPTWGEESFVDSVFTLMKEQFVDQNIPVIIGEFGAIKRMHLTGEKLARHLLSRRHFYEYVASAAKARGMIPVAWDTGSKTNHNMTIIDRNTGEIYDLGLLNALRSGWGLPKLDGDTSLVPESGDYALKILYSEKDSSYGQVDLGNIRSDMTPYDSIIVKLYINGEMNSYQEDGTLQHGWLDLNVVTMSGSSPSEWIWRQARLGETSLNRWVEFSIPIGTDTTQIGTMVPAYPGNIHFFGFQTYSKGYRGTIFIDWIIFKQKDGTPDTVFSFDTFIPEGFGGNVESIKKIPVTEIETDNEWVTATTNVLDNSSVCPRDPVVLKEQFRPAVLNGQIRANWLCEKPGLVIVNLMDLKGRTILSHSFHAKAGVNKLNIPVNYRGVMLLQIKEGNREFTKKIVAHR